MKVKVPVYGTMGKKVSIDPSAGAQIGVNLRGPNGNVLSVAELRALLGLNGSVIQHKDLQGLQQGNDHPQYPLKFGRETIKGQWDFTLPVWTANGSAATPSRAFTGDTNTGDYLVGPDNYGISTGGVLRWDVNTVRVAQNDVPLYLNKDASAVWAFLQFNDTSGAGAPSGRIANDALGTLHFTSNAFSSAPGWVFSRDRIGDPSFMLSLNQDFDSICFHTQAAGSGTFVWDNATVAARLTLGGLWQITASGSTATPAVAVGGTNFGMFVSGGELRFSAAGASFLNGNSDHVDSDSRFRARAGTAEVPGFAFWESDDDNTGMYRIGEDNLGLTTGGTLRFSLGNALAAFSVGVQLSLDNLELALGASQDLRLFHNGTNSFIDNDTGDLVFTTPGDFLFNGVPLGVGDAPTALVGTVAIDGIATTFLRSDGAPALNQAISPTWTEPHHFTKAVSAIPDSPIFITTAIPYLSWDAIGDGANARFWSARVNALHWQLQTFNDSSGANRSAIDVTRGAGSTSITDVSFGNAADNPTFNFLGTGLTTHGGAIATANPGMGAGSWKLGTIVTAPSALDATRYVEVDIGGTVVKLAVVT